MEQTIRVRNAAVQDLEVLTALAVQVQDLHAEGRPDLFRPADPDDLRRFLEGRIEAENIVLLAERSDGTPEGYVLAEYVDRQQSPFLLAHRTLYVHHIAVDRHAQRSGVGEALMAEIVERARVAEADSVRLDSWVFNTGAHRFFETQGFEATRLVFERGLGDSEKPTA